MEQYIDKDVLVEEIERMKVDAIQFPFEEYGTVGTCNKLLSFLDTVEVKEADINKEISQFIDTNFEKATIGHKLSLRRVVKHFFELGLKAQSKDMIEALHTEYEKGRADVIAKACQWLKSYRQDTPDGTGYIPGIINDETIEDFKQSMKE